LQNSLQLLRYTRIHLWQTLGSVDLENETSTLPLRRDTFRQQKIAVERKTKSFEKATVTSVAVRVSADGFFLLFDVIAFFVPAFRNFYIVTFADNSDVHLRKNASVNFSLQTSKIQHTEKVAKDDRYLVKCLFDARTVK